MLALALSLAVLAAPVETSTLTGTIDAGEAPQNFEVIGNQALPESVYRALVNLPEDTKLTAKTARQAQGRILRFLKLAGYELARVEVSVERDRLIVRVDEGRLERFVFLGETGLKAMRLQLMLDLPGRVFNRPELEKQLARLSRDEDLRIIEYRVLPVKRVDAPQIRTEVAGVDLMPQEGSYELHIRVEEEAYPTGFGLELRGESADGIVTGLRYRVGDAIVGGDFLEVAGTFGFRPQKIFDGAENKSWISRAGGRVAWTSPPLFGAPVRLVARAEGAGLSHARDDLGILTYTRGIGEPTLRLLVRPASWVELELGGGALVDAVLQVETATRSYDLDAAPRLEPLAFGSVRFSFPPEEVRRDRRHDLELSARQYFGASARTELSAEYEKSIGFGWNDLVIASGLAGVFGAHPFYGLERVGAHVKGAYADLLYAWAMASAGMEFRLSLSRENLKVGLAYDAALFVRDRDTKLPQLGFANSLAAGLHLLILDSFRFSFYVVGAIATGQSPEPGLALSLTQVF